MIYPESVSAYTRKNTMCQRLRNAEREIAAKLIIIESLEITIQSLEEELEDNVLLVIQED